MPPQQNEFQAWASRLGQTSGVPATRQPYQPNWQYGGGQPQGQLPAPGPIDVESRVIPGPNWQPGAFAKQAMGGKPMGQLSGPPTPKDLVQGTRGMPGGKPDFLGFSNKVPSAGAAPSAAMPPPSGTPTPWESHVSDTLRGDSETAFRDTLRGKGGFQGGNAKPQGLMGRAAGAVKGLFGGSGPSAAPVATPGQTIGQRLSQGVSSARSAGVSGMAGGLLKGVAKGTVLNPAWVASQGVNLGHYAGGVDEVLRGPGGVDEGGVSIGKGMSNLAHAIPGVGGATGTAYDWTLGPFVSAASNAGDVAAPLLAAPFSERARQDLGRMGSNLGSSLSNAWHGKSASAPAAPSMQGDDMMQHLDMNDPQVQQLLSMPDKPGMPAMAQQQHTASLAAAAPHEGDATPVLNPGAAQATPNPGLQNRGPQATHDPLSQMLTGQFQNAMATPYKPAFGPEAFDGLELNPNPVTHGNLVHQMAAANAAGANAHNERLGQAFEMLMRHQSLQAQSQAAQGENQARMMAAQADMARANPLQAYEGSPAGRYMLEQQAPGIGDMLKFPQSMAAPGATELSKNPDASVDDWMKWDQMQHQLSPNSNHHDYIAAQLMRRHGAHGIESARHPSRWDRVKQFFGGGDDDAGRADQWLSQHLRIRPQSGE